MKNIFKYIFKPTIICLVFLLSACEAEKEYAKSRKLVIRDFSMKDISSKDQSKLSEMVAKVKTLNIGNISSNEQAKVVFDEKSGLYFDDEKGVYIEMEDKKSYTFPVLRSSPDEKIKNICFNEKPSGNYDVFVIKYDFTKEEAEQLTNKQLMEKPKEYVQIVKDDITLTVFNSVCVSILVGYETSEFEGVLDGDNTEPSIQWLTIASFCYNEGSGDGGTDGFNGGLGPGLSTGGPSGGDGDDSSVVTGPLIGNTETPTSPDMPVGWIIHYFVQGMDAYLKPVYEAHPELREYLVANNCNASSRAFVTWATSRLYEDPNITIEDLLYNKTEFDTDTGDYNNNTVGNYDNTVYDDFNPQQNTWPNVPSVIPIDKFVGWNRRAHPTWHCMDYSKEQLRVMGYQISNYHATGQTFQIYTAQNGVNTTALKNGLSYMKYALTNGIPVIVGVDDAPGHPGNLDSTTDHFIVVVGMGSDSNGKYFQFYDNASGDTSQGANPANKLYYDSSTGIISGSSQTSYAQNQPYPYRITMIRKSKSL